MTTLPRLSTFRSTYAASTVGKKKGALLSWAEREGGGKGIADRPGVSYLRLSARKILIDAAAAASNASDSTLLSPFQSLLFRREIGSKWRARYALSQPFMLAGCKTSCRVTFHSLSVRARISCLAAIFDQILILSLCSTSVSHAAKKEAGRNRLKFIPYTICHCLLRWLAG